MVCSWSECIFFFQSFWSIAVFSFRLMIGNSFFLLTLILLLGESLMDRGEYFKLYIWIHSCLGDFLFVTSLSVIFNESTSIRFLLIPRNSFLMLFIQSVFFMSSFNFNSLFQKILSHLLLLILSLLLLFF